MDRKKNHNANGATIVRLPLLKQDSSLSCVIALALFVVALFLLLSSKVSDYALLSMLVISAITSFLLIPLTRKGWIAGILCCLVVIISATSILIYVHQYASPEVSLSSGIWVFILGLGFITWRGLELLSAITTKSKFQNLILKTIIPTFFGAWLFFLWEALTTGFSVPQVLLPAPSQIGEVLVSSSKTLMADFFQTFVKAMIPGFLIGCTSGFITALAADRVPFLKRGLLPIGNLISAIPIVGIAPIMVMWFGFDWQSKAAVVAIMTFFPMMVNTLTGLSESNRIERDLLLTYASGYWTELFTLRLPNAMPFIFNALKINSTLAMIGAIVAEFFGTPIVGMGFRISTEVGRMNIDMVWATIAIAALAGSMFYGLFAVMERVFIFWHPSMRKR